jgi:hypothetical protein
MGKDFEKTPVDKTVSKDAIKKYKSDTLSKYGTWDLLWFVVKRHKFAIVVVWAVLVTIDHFVPFAKDLALNVIR